MEQKKPIINQIENWLMRITFAAPIALILYGAIGYFYELGLQNIKGIPIETKDTYGRKETMIAIQTGGDDVLVLQGDIFGRAKYIDKGGDGNLEEVILDKPTIACKMAFSYGYYKRITNDAELQVYQQEYRELYNKVRKEIPTGGFRLEPSL